MHTAMPSTKFSDLNKAKQNFGTNFVLRNETAKSIKFSIHMIVVPNDKFSYYKLKFWLQFRTTKRNKMKVRKSYDKFRAILIEIVYLAS